MRYNRFLARDTVLIVGLLALSSLVLAVAKAAEHKECTWKKCPKLTLCQRVNGKDTCMCRQNVALVLSPVCGSNGKTYDSPSTRPKLTLNPDTQSNSNPWELAAKTCYLNEEVKVVHQGHCKKTSDPCSTVDCGIYNKCKVIEGKARCVTAECPRKCPGRHVSPSSKSDNTLCGTDGKTYDNLCVLRKDNCHSKKYAMVKHKGACQLPPVG